MKRRVINIFIASSIVEFEIERLKIVEFIRNLSDDFEKKYDIKVQPLICENFDTAFSNGRKQEEYNESIRESDLCFFIFFTKLGEYTKEEFCVAREAFQKNGKPKIYTYFKKVKGIEYDKSITEFMTKLDEELGHYYSTFDHIDTVKLRMLLSLKFAEMDFIEIKSENGECIVDGKSVLLPVDKVTEFANNQELKKLKAELAEVEKVYMEMKPIYSKGDCDQIFFKKYLTVLSKRKMIIDEIEEIQKSIFEISFKMIESETSGELTERQRKAYRYFELGDHEACLAELDATKIENDFLEEIKYYEELEIKVKEAKLNAYKNFIKENKTAIDVLVTMLGYKDRFVEITSRYEKIIPVALEMEIELEVVFSFLNFLWQQKQIKKAVEIGESLRQIIEQDEKYLDMRARLYITLANVYKLMPSYEKKVEEYNCKGMENAKILAKSNPEKYNVELIASYVSCGNYYFAKKDLQKAEEHFSGALRLSESLINSQFNGNEGLFGTVYYGVALLYGAMGDIKNSKKYLKKSIKIKEVLAMDDSLNNLSVLGNDYNAIALLYHGQGEFKKAESYYLKAIRIFETLVNENPEGYISALSCYYYNAGLLYKDTGDIDNALCVFEKTIKCLDLYYKENSVAFNEELIQCYDYVACLYKAIGEFKKAETWLFRKRKLLKSIKKLN